MTKISDFTTITSVSETADYFIMTRDNGDGTFTDEKVLKSTITTGTTGIKLLGSKIGFSLNTTGTTQTITLTGGSTFLPTDFVVRNPSMASVNFDSIQFWSSAAMNDYEFALFTSTFNSIDFINTVGFVGNGTALNPQSSPANLAGTSIYGYVTNPEQVASTCDVYIFGYIIS